MYHFVHELLLQTVSTCFHNNCDRMEHYLHLFRFSVHTIRDTGLSTIWERHTTCCKILGRLSTILQSKKWQLLLITCQWTASRSNIIRQESGPRNNKNLYPADSGTSKRSTWHSPATGKYTYQLVKHLGAQGWHVCRAKKLLIPGNYGYWHTQPPI